MLRRIWTCFMRLEHHIESEPNSVLGSELVPLNLFGRRFKICQLRICSAHFHIHMYIWAADWTSEQVPSYSRLISSLLLISSHLIDQLHKLAAWEPIAQASRTRSEDHWWEQEYNPKCSFCRGSASTGGSGIHRRLKKVGTTGFEPVTFCV